MKLEIWESLMTNEEIEKGMAELEAMRAKKDSMSNDEIVAWIKAHAAIAAECCDSTVAEVSANPEAFVASMINDL